MKFEPGKVFITRALNSEDKYDEISACFLRHLIGDWGDLCDEDKFLNDLSVESGGRILSAYNTSFGKIYIITEEDRSYTTIMFANEY